jgi:transcriptional regulator with XRE-family HTH domain
MTKGEIIKILRIKKKISQKDFAKKTGITANYLSLIESGKRNAPISYLKKAADKLDISVNLLVWEDVDLSKFKDKESRILAKKVNENLNDIKKLLFNKIVEFR